MTKKKNRALWRNGENESAAISFYANKKIDFGRFGHLVTKIRTDHAENLQLV